MRESDQGNMLIFYKFRYLFNITVERISY